MEEKRRGRKKIERLGANYEHKLSWRSVAALGVVGP